MARPIAAWVRLRAFLAVGVAGLLVMAVLPADAVEYPDDFVELPFTAYGDMLVDQANGQLFITGFGAIEGLAVVNTDGSGLTMIPNTAGASKMSMTEDGRFVYVALTNGDAIAEIETSTLSVRRLSTGTGSCPTQVAAVAGFVWYAETRNRCRDWSSIRRLDPVTGQVSEQVRKDFVYEPALRALPGSARIMYAETGLTRSHLAVFDVADGNLNLTASSERDDMLLEREVQVTTDGEHVMLPYGGGSVAFHRTSDFSLDTVTTSSVPSYWTAVAANNEVVAIAKDDSDLIEIVDRVRDTPVNYVKVDYGGPGYVEGLRLAGDQLFAVTTGPTLRLYQVDRPAVPPPDLTLEAPSQAYVAKPVTVFGVLSEGSTPIPDTGVTVRQQGTEQPVGIATTDPNGRYSLTFTPQEIGTLKLSAEYAGDSTRKPSKALAELSVVRRPVSLSMTAPVSVQPDEAVSLTGTVLDGDSAYAGAALRIDRRCLGATTWEPFTTVMTDEAGNFIAADMPGNCNWYEYMAGYAGDAERLPASVTKTVQVTWRSASIDLSAPPTVHVGDRIDFGGTLTTSDGPLAEVPLTVRVAPIATSNWRDLDPVTTNSMGEFAFSDAPSQEGTNCYQVQYAGDSRIHPTSTGRCVSATRWATSVDLQGPETAELDEPVLMTGSLVSEGDQPVGGITLAVTRVDGFVGTQALPSVVTEADGDFSIRDVPPAGGDVTYSVAYPGTNSRDAAADDLAVAVSRHTRTLTLAANRRAYEFGQTANLTINLKTDSLRTVQVYAKEAGRANRLIFSGVVPRAGLTLKHRMTRNTQFTATIAEDGRAHAASDALSRSTHAGVSIAAWNWYASTHGYKLYRPTAKPAFTMTVRPNTGDGGCIHMELQRKYAIGWRTRSTTTCRPINSQSKATWTLKDRQPVKTPLRVRATFPGDSTNIFGNSNWVYFKFV